MSKKILFLDRDGTLITEPADFQIDRLDKFALAPDVVPALRRLRDAGYIFVMVTNQDGLGTPSFREEEFRPLQDLLLRVLSSQGVEFEAVRVCPHTAADGCDCRKPKVGMLLDYLRDTSWSREHSVVIGDRETDLQLAAALGVRGLRYHPERLGWMELARVARRDPEPREAEPLRELKVGRAIANDRRARGVNRVRRDVLIDEARRGLAAVAALARPVRADEDRIERDPLGREEPEQEVLRLPKRRLGEGVGAEAVLVRDHHEAVARGLQRDQRADDAGHELQLRERVDLLVGRLLDQRAVAVDEEGRGHRGAFASRAARSRAFCAGSPTVIRMQPAVARW